MTAIVLLPAIWNGFPFVFPDTGGYLRRPFSGDLELGRSAIYGAFLATGIPFDFWPNVFVQALLTAWIIRVVLRTEGLERPTIAVVAIAALCVCTSLPWYASQLEPDVFLPLSVLAFYLIAFASTKLRTWQVATLGVVVAFSIAVHMSIYAVLLLLFVFIATLRALAPRFSLPRPRLMIPLVSILSGTALALASNYVIAGTVAFTPGGSVFLFGRLLQDGFVRTYLDRSCPSASLSLCRYRETLPTESDYWLWDIDSPLGKLGGWRAFMPEANCIIIGSVLQQPGSQVAAVLTGTFTELGAVATGDGFDSRYNWNTELALKEFAPQTLQSYNAAAQQHNAINFGPINLLHIPLALGATLLLPVLVALRRRRRVVIAPFGLTVFIAIVANAAISATFSGVENRYQSRIASIIVFAAALAFRDLLRSHPSQTALAPENDADRIPYCGAVKQ